jgi:flavodoxin
VKLTGKNLKYNFSTPKEGKMKSIIFLHSYHHGNTRKVADVLAEELSSTIVDVSKDEKAQDELSTYDLLGFGAGIDRGRHYKEIIDLAQNLPLASNQKVFIFSTAGLYSAKKMVRDHRALRDILVEKGYNIVGEFSCHGLDTVMGILRLIGGLNKGRPNSKDLERARQFAKQLKNL